jgi:aconitate hydratase
MYLGVRAVIAKSIERIHKANLINFAIVPLEFADESDYDKINENDVLEISGLLEAVKSSYTVTVKNTTQGTEFNTVLKLADRDRDILLADGLLSYTRNNA